MQCDQQPDRLWKYLEGCELDGVDVDLSDAKSISFKTNDILYGLITCVKASLPSLNNKSLSLIQIYTDFDEIRQEIEAETERCSGINKVL